jgi:hypothetical protein
MKLTNSKNLRKLLEHNLETNDFFDVDETLIPGPCFEVKVDKEKGVLACLIDGKEQLTYNLTKINQALLTKEGLCHLIDMLRHHDLDALRKELKAKR